MEGQPQHPATSPLPGFKKPRISDIAAYYMKFPVWKLRRIIMMDEVSTEMQAAARWALQIAEGDNAARDKALDRWEGPVKQVVEHTPGPRPLQHLTDDELLRLPPNGAAPLQITQITADDEEEIKDL